MSWVIQYIFLSRNGKSLRKSTWDGAVNLESPNINWIWFSESYTVLSSVYGEDKILVNKWYLYKDYGWPLLKKEIKKKTLKCSRTTQEWAPERILLVYSMIVKFNDCVILYTYYPIFQDKLGKSEHKILVDYHSATVSLLALISAGTAEVN